jgi:colicin import membrane protein
VPPPEPAVAKDPVSIFPDKRKIKKAQDTRVEEEKVREREIQEKKQQEQELAKRMQELQRQAEQKKQQEERQLAKKIEEQRLAAERREAIRKEEERKKAAAQARLEQIRAENEARAAAEEARRLAAEARAAQDALARTRADATAKAAAIQSAATNTTGGRKMAGSIAEQNYVGAVVQRVRTYWKKPEGASWDATLLASVVITVNRNGEVTGIRFTQRSRNAQFDVLAEKTIRTAAPMPAFPAVMLQESTEIGLNFKPGELGNS